MFSLASVKLHNVLQICDLTGILEFLNVLWNFSDFRTGRPEKAYSAMDGTL